MSANTTSQSDYINKLFNFYDSKGYYYRYSGSVGLTVVVIIVFFLINSYLFIRIIEKVSFQSLLLCTDNRYGQQFR